MKLIEYPDREMMMIDLANKLAGELAGYLTHSDKACLAVPGGSTPGPVFDALCAADLAWDKVCVMLTDERWVPESSDRSNTRLLRERLLTDRAAAARYLPLYAAAPQPEDRLDELTTAVVAELPLSVLLLGMGADMHTASLFPGADRLAEALDDHEPALMAMRAPGAPEPRITLTAPVLKGAMSTHFVITGIDKREAVERAYTLNDPMVAPVTEMLPGSTVHWAE